MTSSPHAATFSAKELHPGTWLWCTGWKRKDLTHYFNKDGLGAIVNSSRGIIAAYKQEKYAQFGAENFADASRQAVIDMIEDIASALK